MDSDFVLQFFGPQQNETAASELFPTMQLSQIWMLETYQV